MAAMAWWRSAARRTSRAADRAAVLERQALEVAGHGTDSGGGRDHRGVRASACLRLRRRVRRRFDGLLALSTLFAEAGAFPSSLPALLGDAAPTRASQEAALAATLRRMMRARQSGASTRAA